jgi:hypothetical protein
MIKRCQTNQFNNKTKGGENRMKRIMMIMLMLAFVVAMNVQISYAIPMLAIYDGSNWTYINDNGAGDNAGSISDVVSHTYTLSGFILTATGYVWSLSNDSPSIDLSVTGGGAGNLDILVLFQDDGYTVPDGSTFDMLVTGSITGSATPSYSMWKNYFGSHEQIGNTLTGFGNITGTGGLTQNDYLGLLTMVTLNDEGNVRITLSSDQRGNSVPEPGTLLLLGTGFASLAFYARRKRQ